MAPRHYGLQKQTSSKPSILKNLREKYPFRVVRDHNPEPKPEKLPVEVFGNFAKFPMKTGDEWFFESQQSLEKFVSLFGGTPFYGSSKRSPARPKLPQGLAGGANSSVIRRSSPIPLAPVDLSGMERSGALLDSRLRARK